MRFSGWLTYCEATHFEYSGGDWGVKAFLDKHDNKWIVYKGKTQSPALYLVRLWQRNALNEAKRLAWNDSGNYYEALAKYGYEIATSDQYPLCDEYLYFWDILSEDP